MSSLSIKNYLNKVTLFFKSGETTYWNSITECDIETSPEEVSDYYLNFISKADYPDRLDSSGIPLYQRSTNEEIYHPIVIAQYALGLYKKFKMLSNEDDDLRTRFILQADWFVNNFSNVKDIPVWKINYDISEYHLKSPWVSAMAQGEVISVLIRAHIISDKKAYLNLASEAIKLFEINVLEGGIVSEFEGKKVYEEYPSPIRPVCVLNGFIFSLFGLYDLHLMGNKKSGGLFNDGIASLIQLLPYYDLGYWSQYYLFDHPKKYPASYTYHCLAIEQLKALYIITGEERFKVYYKKWESYKSDAFKKLRVVTKKILSARKLK